MSGSAPLRRHRRLPAVVVAVALAAGAIGTVSSAPRRADVGPRASIDPALLAVLDHVSPDASIGVLVVLRDQLDPARVNRNVGERASAAVVRELRATALRTQAGIRSLVRDGLASRDVLTATPLWIINAVAVTARPAFIAGLAARPEVASILPETTLSAPVDETGAASAGTEPNIDLVGAPALWALGFRGAGVTIASLDTGVDAAHPDLAAQWRGDAGVS